jgi:hypothetical protein
MSIATGFGWKDIDTVILGNIPVFISEITYKVTKNRQNKYGRGDQPVARVSGNKEYECTMTLGIEEMAQIEAAVAAKYGEGYDPTDVEPFDIPVTYDNGKVVKQDVIRGFQWNEWAGGASQGDTTIDKTLPGICAGIDFAVPI